MVFKEPYLGIEISKAKQQWLIHLFNVILCIILIQFDLTNQSLSKFYGCGSSTFNNHFQFLFYMQINSSMNKYKLGTDLSRTTLILFEFKHCSDGSGN